MPPETPETPAPATGSPLERGAEKLNSVVSGLNGSIDKLSGILGSLGGGAGAIGASAGGASAVGLDKLMKAFEMAKGDAKKFGELLNKKINNISTSSSI